MFLVKMLTNTDYSGVGEACENLRSCPPFTVWYPVTVTDPPLYCLVPWYWVLHLLHSSICLLPCRRRACDHTQNPSARDCWGKCLCRAYRAFFCRSCSKRLEGLSETSPVLRISMVAFVGVLLGDKIWAAMHAYRVPSKGMSTNYLYAHKAALGKTILAACRPSKML